MIAYHFPPVKGSSGIQRTLRFAQYLPALGWSPIVLTPHPRVYAATSDEDMKSLSGIEIHRSFALDTRKHLSMSGRYLRMTALPDKWSTWWFGGVFKGMQLIKKFRPDIIWSTYPVATAHLIGMTLHKLSGIPWVSDFRDPMAQDGYPSDPLTWKSFDWIERKAAKNANALTFTTPGALREYSRRYPEAINKFSLIENGYDEETFSQASQELSKTIVDKKIDKPFTLIHSGIIYPSERDPTHLFVAIAHLLKKGTISPSILKVVLRATGHDDYLRELINRNGIQSIVEIAPSVTYSVALKEMLEADGLLILQASNCNDQIPAKLYEYLRARRPILGLTDLQGDTAKTLRSSGIDTLAPLNSTEAIVTALENFIALLKNGQAPIASDQIIASASRQGRTKEFAHLLNQLV